MTCEATGERFCSTSPWEKRECKSIRVCVDCGTVYTYNPPSNKAPSLREILADVEEAENELERHSIRLRNKIASAIE